MVAITGNAPNQNGRDAFQEVDFLGITMPIVKHSFLVLHPEDIAQAVHDAFHIAQSDRPGPVVIDIPKDVLLAEVQNHSHCAHTETEPCYASEELLKQAKKMLEHARSPLVYGGGGIGIAGCVDTFRNFVETLQLPTVLTLKGLGALPTDHSLLVGMLGMHGNKAANLAVQSCDVLVCVGARFDDRVTGHLERFAPNAKVIHLDIDPAEVGKRRDSDIPLIGTLSHSLKTLTRPSSSEWAQNSEALAAREKPVFDVQDGVNPEAFWRIGSSRSVPLSQAMWSASNVGGSAYTMHHPQQHLSSGGLGTMGFGLPAAIGAQLACPGSLVVNVSGDGGIMMNIQELATIYRYQLPIKVVVIDNARLGMVRQWQDLFLGRRYSEVDLSDNPDFAELAKAFQIPAIQLQHSKDMAATIDAIVHTKGPLLVHVLVHPEGMVWPIVPPGCANEEMLEAPCPSL